MEMAVNAVFDAETYINDSILFTNLHIFTVNDVESDIPVLNVTSKNPNAKWGISSPAIVSGAHGSGNDGFSWVSATCYFFITEIYKRLGGSVPLGFVGDNWGGTIVEAWSSPDALAKCPQHSSSDGISSPFTNVNVNGNVNGDVTVNPNQPSHLYNGMIYPILNFRFLGAVWYQGESNNLDPTGYACKFPAMIADWRVKFGLPDLYFFFVQLAPWDGGAGTYAAIRQAQLAALSLPRTGVACTIDLGDPASPFGSIHPRNKMEVGRRLSLVAWQQIYNHYEIIASGAELTAIQWPTFDLGLGSSIGNSHDSNDAAITLYFGTEVTGTALHLSGTEECVKCCTELPFIIGTSDGQSTRALNATVNNAVGTIAVAIPPELLTRLTARSVSSSVPVTITSISYAYEDEPQCALFNSANLPTIPFISQKKNPTDDVTKIEIITK